jgi:sulfonate transport system ATP-binding protein
VVKIRGLSRTFGATKVLNQINMDVAEGELVALLGRSGSGKTTLLRTLAGIDSASPEIVTTPDARAVVFQEPRLFPWKSVSQNVAIGLRGDRIQERSEEALKEVELEHRVNAWPLTLSGGEAQRAALARALVRNPQLLLLDEPLASLDALTRLKMQDLILSLWMKHHPAILLVTHDIDEAIHMADRILVLGNGEIEAEIQVNLPRPRNHGTSRFGEIRYRLLEILGVKAR